MDGFLLPYELPGVARALSKCKTLSPIVLSLEVPEKIHKDSEAILNMEIHILKPSHDLFDIKINDLINKQVVAEWTK